MIEASTVPFLEGGCALIVATVGPDGAPHGTRGWGLDVLDAGAGVVRLLLSADDVTTREQLEPGAAVAVTGADVPTLRSVQLKGRSLGVEPGTDDDRARALRFTDAFFSDITATDGTPRAVLDRLVPLDVVACTVQVEQLFDQTPGPGAGTRLGAGA